MSAICMYRSDGRGADKRIHMTQRWERVVLSSIKEYCCLAVGMYHHIVGEQYRALYLERIIGMHTSAALLRRRAAALPFLRQCCGSLPQHCFRRKIEQNRDF